MKYQPPTQKPYESGLTAELMYDAVDKLINKYLSSDDIAKARNAISNSANDYDSVNIWRKPRIRNELEEFVRSYFFGDFDEQLPGFGKVFMGYNTRHELKTYIDALAQEYNSRNEAYKVISEARGRIVKYFERILDVFPNVNSIEGDLLVKANTREAFGHLSATIHMRIINAMWHVGI